MGMSQNLITMMEGDISYAMTDVSSTLRQDKLIVKGTSGSVVGADSMDDSGQLLSADFEFVSALSNFGKSIPAIRSVVDVDGVKYYVERVDNDGACLTISLRRGNGS